MDFIDVDAEGPAQALSIVPLLLGCEPSDGDVVLLGMNEASQIAVTYRWQGGLLAVRPNALDEPLANARRAGTERVLIIGYGTEHQIMPALGISVVAAAGQALAVDDVVRVQDDRYWSYRSGEPEGAHWQRETAASTKARVDGGGYAAKSRAHLAARIAEPADEACQAAARRAVAEPMTVGQGHQAVTEALAAAAEGRPLDDYQCARLALALRSAPVHDVTWAQMTPDLWERHAALWEHVTSRVSDVLVAPPATMLAITAWQGGNAPLAQVALERALAAEPDDPLAGVVRAKMNSGLPPAAANAPMSLEEVRQAYSGIDPGLEI
jgi:hypothetical protein